MYAKLFSRIAQSSLMEERVNTRYVFMMMLALSDRHGDVIGTDVAIARMINVPLDEFIEAIETLMLPDDDSNSHIEDGRRIIPSESGRGYKVVNYEAYRLMKSDDEKREYMREYMRNRRKVKGLARDVNRVNFCKTQSNDVTQAEAEAEAEKNTCPQADVLAKIWNICPSLGKSRSSKKQVADAWRKIPSKDKPDDDALLGSFDEWIRSDDWTKDDGSFVPGLHLWIKNQKWEVTPTKTQSHKKKGSLPDGFGV